MGRPLLFRTFARSALEERSLDVSRGWHAIQLVHLRAHLLPFFGRLLLRAISPRHIERFKVLRRTQGAAASTLNKELSTLSVILTYAAALSLISFSPVSLVRRAPREEERVPAVLTEDEVSRLLEAARGDPFGAFVWISLYTGARPGEVLRLRHSDVDLASRTITLEHRLDHPTKTRRARVVPIFEPLAAYLAGLPVPLDPTRPLFTHQRHYRSFARIARAARVRTTAYALRHTAATVLARADVPAPKIARLLGHRSTSTTARYIHLEVEDLRDLPLGFPVGPSVGQKGDLA